MSYCIPPSCPCSRVLGVNGEAGKLYITACAPLMLKTEDVKPLYMLHRKPMPLAVTLVIVGLFGLHNMPAEANPSNCVQPALPPGFRVLFIEFSPLIPLVASKVSTAKALDALRVDYLDRDGVADFAEQADVIFQSSSSVRLPSACVFTGSVCNLRPCGCPIGSGRKLLQCIPRLTCATNPPAEFLPSPIDRKTRIVVVICTEQKCIYFRIKESEDGPLTEAFGQICPGRPKEGLFSLHGRSSRRTRGKIRKALKKKHG